MKFDVTILGSGSAVPTLRRNSTAQVVNINEEYFLVDCAEGTQLQMRRFEIKMQRINEIFISHLHGDHYLGLPGLLQTLHLLGRTRRITVFGPEELKILLSDHFTIARSTLRFPLEIIPVDVSRHYKLFENNRVEVWSIPLKHKVDTSGYLFREKPRLRKIRIEALREYRIPVYWLQRIKEGEDYVTEEGRTIPNAEITTDPVPPKSYAYCSDTVYNEDIVPIVKNVDLLYHEASFLEDMKQRALETLHSTAADAARIAAQARVGKLMIGHFSARYRGVETFLDQAREHFFNTIIAEDGLTINLYDENF